MLFFRNLVLGFLASAADGRYGLSAAFFSLQGKELSSILKWLALKSEALSSKTKSLELESQNWSL